MKFLCRFDAFKMTPISPLHTSSSSLIFMHLAKALFSFILLGQQQSRLSASEALERNPESHLLVTAYQRSRDELAVCKNLVDRKHTIIMVNKN